MGQPHRTGISDPTAVAASPETTRRRPSSDGVVGGGIAASVGRVLRDLVVATVRREVGRAGQASRAKSATRNPCQYARPR